MMMMVIAVIVAFSLLFLYCCTVRNAANYSPAKVDIISVVIFKRPINDVDLTSFLK